MNNIVQHVEDDWKTILESRRDRISSELQSNSVSAKDFMNNQLELKEMLKTLLTANMEAATPSPSQNTCLRQGICASGVDVPVAFPSGNGEPNIPARSGTSSWMTGDTHILTPTVSAGGREVMTQNLPMPQQVGAVSTDVSENQPGIDASETCGSFQQQVLPTPLVEECVPSVTEAARPAEVRINSCQPTNDPNTEGSLEQEWVPHSTSDPIACNKLCWILHPHHPDEVVAVGITGGSWRSKTMKFGALCVKGEQMVQIHKVAIPNVRVLYSEDRFQFDSIDEAVVNPSCTKVYIKWASKYILKKE